MVLRPSRPSQPPVSITGAEVHALPHINVSGTAPPGDRDAGAYVPGSDAVAGAQASINGLVRVDSIAGLHRFLVDLTRTPPAHAASLDLIGSSMGTGVLRLGRSTIDATVPEVLDVFEAIGQEQLLPRLGIRVVRLVGARTATEQVAQDTLRRLRQFLGVPVLGTTSLVTRDDFTEDGFDRSLDCAFVDDRGAGGPRKPVVLPPATTPARSFGFDAIGIVRESALPKVPWPRFVVPRTFDLRQLSNQVRDAGHAIPGLLALPRCELLLPAGRMAGEERFRVIEVLFNWELIRIHGPSLPGGAIYPVVSSQRFTRLVNLPQYQA
jgi:hypothetical protein